jgi:uncharacterized protein (TIGR03435 family)
MKRLGDAVGNWKKPLLSAVGLAIVSTAIVFGLSDAKSLWAQSQTQNTSAATPAFEFDAVSIKPSKLGPEDAWGYQTPKDGLVCKNVPFLMVIRDAYGVFEHDRILGFPNWLDSERYNVEAKLDGNAADEFQKLTKGQRRIAWQHMLQTLLADRIKLTVHRETRELPVFFLVVAKSGLKLQESKINESDPNAPKGPAYGGTVRITGITTTGQRITSSDFAGWLSGELGRTVLDKTGLTGKYDFTLQYTREQDELQPASNRPDFTFPPLLTAIQQQLGLKLESGKGPVEVIVIDHVERPSGN